MLKGGSFLSTADPFCCGGMFPVARNATFIVSMCTHVCDACDPWDPPLPHPVGKFHKRTNLTSKFLSPGLGHRKFQPPPPIVGEIGTQALGSVGVWQPRRLPLRGGRATNDVLQGVLVFSFLSKRAFHNRFPTRDNCSPGCTILCRSDWESVQVPELRVPSWRR